MVSEKWKRRRTVPTIRTTSPLPIPNGSGSETNLAEPKKSRSFSKALRSLSNSSMESMSHSPSRNSTGRRLHKNSSGSGSMIERIHRRVSKDSPVTASPPELAPPALEIPHASMEIIQYGPLKADITLLKARSEYLVLTDHCLSKFSGIDVARATYPQLGQPEKVANKRSSMHFGSSTKPLIADAKFEIPLRSIVAAFNDEGSSPRFGLEVWWFSQWPRLSFSKTHLFFALPNDRDAWLADIHRACKLNIRRSPGFPLIPDHLKTRINDIAETFEPGATEQNQKIMSFPVAKRNLGLPQKSSSGEDAQHVTEGPSTYIVLGPSMCYLLEVAKADYMTMPNELRVKVQSFGSVTLTRFKASVATQEQRFVMSFRMPFGRETRLELASTHYRRIIEAMTKHDRILKPMWPQHLQQAIFDIKGLPPPLSLTSGNDLGGLERSLNAYCAAFNVLIPRWIVEWSAPSEPTFRLLPSGGAAYSPLQLLAVFRALRYNSYFKALCFRDVDLSAVVGKRDYSQYGDSVAYTSLNGHGITEEHYDILAQAPVLTQEFHALIFASESIRSVDLRNLLGLNITSTRSSGGKIDSDLARRLSAEVMRPILLLLRSESSRCHSISLSDNILTASDVEELANLLVLDHVVFKKLELSKCSLGDEGLTRIWTGLSGQAASLQALDTSDNQGTVKFEIMAHTLSEFRAIKKLNIAGNTRLGYGVTLFDEEALSTWELEELDVSGIAINQATVDQLATYLSNPISLKLRVLRLNNCGLTGRQVAHLFHEMGEGRGIMVYINGNRLDEGIDDLCEAIACGAGPWGLFIQMIEFALEENYIKLLRALTMNATIECLSLAGTATPDAASERACQAVSDFFSGNDAVRYLDISGFDAKLDEGRLGRGFSRALSGLKSNRQLEHLRVRSQMLNVNIGDLAEAITANKTLHSLDCEDNDFNLSNYRHLVKHLADNTTIRYFSAFSNDGLVRTIHRSIDNALATATSHRRQSTMLSMFRTERPPSSVSRPLVQQLRDGWDDVVQTRAQIIKRNRLLYEDGEDDRIEAHIPTIHRYTNGDDVFSKAFGGLARRAYESQKDRATSARKDIDVSYKRYSILSLSPSTTRLLGLAVDSATRAKRSNSNLSSDGAASPAPDSASTGSAMQTPPELESPVEKEYSLGVEHEQQQPPQQPQSLEGNGNGPLDYEFAFLDVQDTDFGLEMRAHQRFWSEEAGCIEEEDNRFLQVNDNARR